MKTIEIETAYLTLNNQSYSDVSTKNPTFLIHIPDFMHVKSTNLIKLVHDL